MSIEGRIAIDVNFTDTSTAGGASSVKKISLVDTQAYSSGKVAIVTGTVGSAQDAYIYFSAMSYVNAAGATQTMTPTRVALSVSGALATVADNAVSLSRTNVNGSAASVAQLCPLSQHLQMFTTAGTAAYTAVFYGT